jgi:hypothetical protein
MMRVWERVVQKLSTFNYTNIISLLLYICITKFIHIWLNFVHLFINTLTNHEKLILFNLFFIEKLSLIVNKIKLIYSKWPNSTCIIWCTQTQRWLITPISLRSLLYDKWLHDGYKNYTIQQAIFKGWIQLPVVIHHPLLFSLYN